MSKFFKGDVIQATKAWYLIAGKTEDEYLLECVQLSKDCSWSLHEQNWFSIKSIDNLCKLIHRDSAYKRYIKLSGLYEK